MRERAGRAALAAIYDRLDAGRRQTLLAFARHLEAQPGAAPRPAPRPEPRPAGETVVMALRRLARTYPMLDRGRLMVEATTCLSRHMLEAYPADAAIEELEVIFARHYATAARGARTRR